SLDHFVTQWMSTVTVWLGSARRSFQVHDKGSSTSPRMVNVHSDRGVCGVGPADNRGKSLVTYCPGGTRARSTPAARLPRKPRENVTGAPSLCVLPQRSQPFRPSTVRRLARLDQPACAACCLASASPPGAHPGHAASDRSRRYVSPDDLRWLWLAHICAGNLWDETTLDTTCHVQLARESGQSRRSRSRSRHVSGHMSTPANWPRLRPCSMSSMPWQRRRE